MSGCPAKIKYLPGEDVGEIITDGKRQSAAGISSTAQVARNQTEWGLSARVCHGDSGRGWCHCLC